MIDEILNLSKKLISIRSDPDNKVGLDTALDVVLNELAEFTVELFEQNGFKSILAYNTPTRPDKFRIILNGHLDVIPGKDFQYEPVEKEGRLYGVGSMDMKSSVATMIYTFKQIAKELSYPIAIQLVTDEEVGGFNGTKYQIEKGVRADFVIAGESTNFDIVNQAKGVFWLKISCKGKTAHGAYPHKGENAIWKMDQFLQILKNHYPLPSEQIWDTTVNLAKIENTNNTFNKIPDDCTVWLDIRTTPEKSENLLNELKKIIPNDFDTQIIAEESALFVEQENDYLQKLKISADKILQKAVCFYGAQGSSDSRHYTKIGGKGVEFGPWGGGIGTDNEWVDISSLEKFYLILSDFLQNMN
jgi:succinyl-diaminopimelate desuccinylase